MSNISLHVACVRLLLQDPKRLLSLTVSGLQLPYFAKYALPLSVVVRSPFGIEARKRTAFAFVFGLVCIVLDSPLYRIRSPFLVRLLFLLVYRKRSKKTQLSGLLIPLFPSKRQRLRDQEIIRHCVLSGIRTFRTSNSVFHPLQAKYNPE